MGSVARGEMRAVRCNDHMSLVERLRLDAAQGDGWPKLRALVVHSDAVLERDTRLGEVAVPAVGPGAESRAAPRFDGPPVIVPE